MKSIDTKTITEICRYARLAPSVHNVQPWEFVADPKQITVRINKQRTLDAGDPVGRETWISMGACVETLVIAASHLGVHASVKTPSRHEIKIALDLGAKPDKIELKTIKERFTDRSVYSKKPIDPALLKQIEKSWKSKRVQLIVSADRKLIETVSDLTGRGMTLAMQSKDFRNEIASLINRPFARKSVGFSPQSLRVRFLQALVQPNLAKSKYSVRFHKIQERQRMLSASALVMSFSVGDTYEDWFEAGRAYQRAGLTATQLGVRQATSAAAVEAADFHTDIERMLGTKHRLQTLMRIGYSHKKHVVSPRIPTKKLLKTT